MKTLYQIARFALVGCVGFVIDGGLLLLLVAKGIDPLFARVFSFPIAVLATWWLNRIWTFSHAAKEKPRRQFNRYFGLQLVGALTNFLVYVVALSFMTVSPTNIFLAFAAGSFVGMIVNYLGSRKFIFVSLTGKSAKN